MAPERWTRILRRSARTTESSPETEAEDLASDASDQDLVPPVSHPLLDAPHSVVAGEEFALSLGLRPDPSSDLLGSEPIEIPPETGPQYHLTVHVTAIGFSIREGENWRHTLFVDWTDQPYPSTTIHLTAEPLGEAPAQARFIKATYEVGGHTVSVAARAIAVLAEPASPLPPMPKSRLSQVHIPISDVPPDLTVHLFRDSEEGRLWMTFNSSNDQIRIPDEELELSVGDSSEEFARQLVDSMNAVEGGPAMWDTLLGASRRIGRVLQGRNGKGDFWRILHEVVDGVADGIPSVLLLSEEPYIPWELASEPGPDNDAGEKPYLSQRVAIGRWPLDIERQPPPHFKSVQAMAVVSGDYEDIPYWDPLKNALQEAGELERLYSAVHVEATYDLVRSAIQGNPIRDVLHMAIHGKYDAHSIENGLILINPEDREHVTLTPTAITGMTVPGEPFVFLNACQVGNNSEVLGLYSGVAAAFLDRGATAVVAPLWNVKDDRAKTVAVEFYEDVFANTPVGEAMRRRRVEFDANSETSTFMAYQYFGHPLLRITRSNGVT